MTGFWEVGAAMCAALASLDFFASVFYQAKIEGPAGEAKVELKIEFIILKVQF